MANSLTLIEMRILMVCRLYGEPVPVDLLRTLAGDCPEDISALLELPIAGKWLERSGHEYLAIKPTLPRKIQKNLDALASSGEAAEIVNRIRHNHLLDKVPVGFIVELHRLSGREKEGAELLSSQAIQLAKRYQLDSAFEYCWQSLELLRTQLADRESCGQFLESALFCSDLCHILGANYDQVRRLHEETEQTALKLGDLRRLTMIYFHKGRRHMAFQMLEDAVHEIEKAIAMVADLGDQDMVAWTSGFRTYYFFSQGLTKETAANAEQAMSFEPDSPHIHDPAIPIILALSSIAMGNLHRAVGVVESVWQRSLNENWDEWTRTNLQSALGQVQLLCRRLDQAQSHLLASEAKVQAHGDAKVLLWVRRLLAYHSFLEGRIDQAYQTLSQSISTAQDYGIHRLFYGLPWFLELLHQFHRLGYQPISGCEYASELEAALRSPNVLLRGSALRLRAKDTQLAGADLGTVRGLLLRSQAELEVSGAVAELAKTRAELALLELDRNADGAAADLAMKAWEGWLTPDKNNFPAKLLPFIGGQSREPVGFFSEKKLLSQYMEMIQALMVKQESQDLHAHLLNTTSKFFDAERAGLLSVTNEGDDIEVRLLKGFNLTEKQIMETSFQASMEIIIAVHQEQKPVSTRFIDKESDSGGSALCLPMRTGQGAPAVLYFDMSMAHGQLTNYDRTTLGQIAQHLGNIVTRAVEEAALADQRTSSMLGEVTTGNNFIYDLPITYGPSCRGLIARASQVAASDASILIMGETGVGKSVLARNIHDLSHRRAGPFISVDLSTIPDNLVESELFGHEKGAFTGADRQKQGLMELSNRGTLFIDEVGEIPKAIQVKLLRAIEEKSFVRVGGIAKRTVDFRLIVATNRDLVKEVEAGNFREDLYYRLCVVPFIVPPLRERGDDVVRLAAEFIDYYSKKYHLSLTPLSLKQQTLLKSYHWPGNIRELRNVIERSLILSDNTRLELDIVPAPGKLKATAPAVHQMFSDAPTLDEVQRRYIQHVLEQTGGRLSGPSGATAILGMKRSTLQHRMTILGMKKKDQSIETLMRPAELQFPSTRRGGELAFTIMFKPAETQ